jgi:hypothetical protein
MKHFGVRHIPNRDQPGKWTYLPANSSSRRRIMGSEQPAVLPKVAPSIAARYWKVLLAMTLFIGAGHLIFEHTQAPREKLISHSSKIPSQQSKNTAKALHQTSHLPRLISFPDRLSAYQQPRAHRPTKVRRNIGNSIHRPTKVRRNIGNSIRRPTKGRQHANRSTHRLVQVRHDVETKVPK